MSATSCSISTLNNKAISLVQKGESRNAIKLFLQALSQLKFEVRSQKKATYSSGTEPSNAGSPFIRVTLSKMEHEQSGDSATDSSFAVFDQLVALNPKVDSCAPQQRDGTTAALLYNMALSYQHMSQSRHCEMTSKSCLHLKKAASTFAMAFSASQHWKRWTKTHIGCSVLELAILNNLIGLHSQMGSADKVKQLQACYCKSLGAASRELSQEEKSFFVANLERSPAVVSRANTSQHTKQPATENSQTQTAAA